jgi:long-chain acyl-CoA synthetase
MSVWPTSLNRLLASLIPADLKIERMLERPPAVGQAGVVPIDDDIKGQKPVPFIVAKSGAPVDAEEIKRFALASAPAYQHPRFVSFVDRLPLSAKNKIDRTALRRVSVRRLKEMGTEATQ